MIGCNAKPLLWRRSRRNDPVANTTTVGTVVPWNGHASIPGAFIITRINLEFLNETCTKFSSTLDTAANVCEVLQNTQVYGATKNQVKRYGYMLLRMEAELRNTLEYLTDLLLCSGRGKELWTKFVVFRNKSSTVWKLLRRVGVNKISQQFPERKPLILISNKVIVSNSSQKVTVSEGTHLMEILEQARPQFSVERRSHPGLDRKPKGFFLIGAALGIISTFIADRIFLAKFLELF